MKTSRLSKLVSPGGKWIKDDESGVFVYDVANQHVLVQAAGYLKHVLAKDATCGVFFRGQTKLYPALLPSLYRGATTQAHKQARDKALADYLKSCEGNVMSAVPDYAREPPVATQSASPLVGSKCLT